MKNIVVKYNVGKMDNVERLSFQNRLLVQSIKECCYEVKNEDGSIVNEVVRSDIFERWSELCKSKDNVKVFASLIHHFIVFGFLEKLTKVKVFEKNDVINMFNKMSDSDKLELIEMMKVKE